MAAEISIERREGGVAILTLNAPDRRNALTVAMAEELVEACEELDARPRGRRRGGARRGRLLLRRWRSRHARGGRPRSGGPGGLRRPRCRLPLVRARRRARGADCRCGARRRGGRRPQPDARHRRAHRRARRQDHLRLHPDRPAPGRRARCPARAHRRSRGRRGNGAVRRAHRRRARSGAGPGMGGGGRRRRRGHRGRAGRTRGRRSRAGPPHSRLAPHVLGPPPLPWPAALELERASQMWSMRRKALG